MLGCQIRHGSKCPLTFLNLRNTSFSIQIEAPSKGHVLEMWDAQTNALFRTMFLIEKEGKASFDTLAHILYGFGPASYILYVCVNMYAEVSHKMKSFHHAFSKDVFMPRYAQVTRNINKRNNFKYAHTIFGFG